MRGDGMKLFHRAKITGTYIIEDDAGNVYTKKNVIVQNFFTAVISYLNGTTTAAIGVTKFGFGTGTTAAAKADTALAASVFEKAITAGYVGSTYYKCKVVLGPSECNFRIREIGVFAGSTLISRVNVDKTKTSSNQYTVTYILTIE